MRRKLSEAAMFVWAGGQVPINHALTVQLSGQFSQAHFKTALAAVRGKYPHLAGRIVQDADGVWHESDGVPDFPVRTVTGDWTAEVAQELTTLFPTAEGPLVRFLIVTSEPHTYLSMICHHCIADGMSSFYVLRDILSVLADPAQRLPALPPLPPLMDMLPPLDFSTFSPGNVPFPDPETMPEAAPTSTSIYVLPWALTTGQTSALVACCRAEGTTVHAALSTALLVTHARLQIGSDSMRRIVSTPMNFRSRLTQPVGENFGLFIHSGTNIALDCQPGRDFWTMTREFGQALKRDLSNENVFGNHVLAAQVLSMMPYEQVLAMFAKMPVEYDLSITNLGRLDLPLDYGDFQVQAIYGPAVNALENERVLGVATAAGCLSFTFVSRHSLMDFATAQLMRDVTMEQLAVAVGW